VGPFDPAILSGTVVLLEPAALAACYLPARRTAGMSPTLALRYE
jgi:hypothetical protein